MNLIGTFTFSITVLFVYLIVVNIIFYITDYINERKKILYYISVMNVNNFYRKWFFPNSFLKDIINTKIFPSKKNNYIFLKRFIFATMKYSKLFREIKIYHVKASYLKPEKVYSIRCFLVLNPLFSKEFEKRLIVFKQEVFNIIKDSNETIIFNVDIL